MDAWTRSAQMLSLIDMPESAYLSIAFGVDERTLRNLDFTCRASRLLNKAPIGPWRSLGLKRYRNVQIEREGKFGEVPSPLRAGRPRPANWKARYFMYARTLATFRLPFTGREITCVDEPDEVAYCRCMVPRLQFSSDSGVYIEFLVLNNPDNLSVALVDFQGGPGVSMTFSPETGTVIWERKVQETPRKVEGAYIQALDDTSVDEGAFEGSLGIYVNAGHVAFFRRGFDKKPKQPSFWETWFSKSTKQSSVWETTGYVTDLNWAASPCVTPCVGFRDEGLYHVRIVGIGSVPPVDPGRVPAC